MPVLLAQLRNLFGHLLISSLGHGATAGSCLYAAFLVRESLANFRPQYTTVVRGGDGNGDGGCVGADGIVRGHYWVEVTLPDGTKWVADITGDQFGLPPVQWLPLPAWADRYLCGDQDVVDGHITTLAAEIEEDAKNPVAPSYSVRYDAESASRVVPKSTVSSE